MKKWLSVFLSVVLAVTLVSSSVQMSVQAAEASFDTADMTDILNDVVLAGQAWESVGFNSQDVADIAGLPQKPDSFYAPASSRIAALSVETPQTRMMENRLKNQPQVGVYATNGNPPESPEDQVDRLVYVTNVAKNRYGNTEGTEAFSRYVLYLYISHYIDNPNYTKESPGFDNIYAYVITADDIAAYNKFIQGSRFSMFSSNVINFVNELYTELSSISDVKKNIADGKIVSMNSAEAIYNLKEYSPDAAVRRAGLIKTSLMNHYNTAQTVAELIDAMYADLEPEEITKPYIENCVFGLVGAFTGTTTLFGFGLGMTLVAYNFYNNLIDRARLVSLMYSLSMRTAGRLDELIGL